MDIDKIYNVKQLCKLCEELGYGRYLRQGIFDNGSAMSSLIDFLNDNPGCIEIILSWIKDNVDIEDSEELEEV